MKIKFMMGARERLQITCLAARWSLLFLHNHRKKGVARGIRNKE
jgi:hypothetical protein